MTKKIYIKLICCIALCLILMMGGVLFTGCASVEDEFEKLIPGKLPEKDANTDYSPLKKYDEKVTITVLGTDYEAIGDVPNRYNGKPSGPSNNAFNDAALKHLNIELKYMSVVSGAAYEERLSALIAANDVPDIFITSDTTVFETLNRTGLIQDIAPTFYYLNEDLQDMYLDENFYTGLQGCMKEGKLYAFPNLNNPYESAQKLYIRKDWLNIVNKSVPTTYEELVAVAKAFRDNAAAIAATESNVEASQIVPIGMTKEIATIGNNTAQGFFNIFGTQPDAYFEKNGKLISANTSDEMKTALTELNKLYSERLIHQEFYSHSDAKVSNDVISGKVGIISGMWHVASYPIQESMSNDSTPNAEWVSIELPSFDGKSTKPIVEKVMLQNYNMISSKCKNPDALAKLINLFHDMFYSDSAIETYGDLATPEGGFFYSWVPAKVWYAPYSMQSYERVLGVFNELYDSGFRISNEKYEDMMKKEFNWKAYYDSILADNTYKDSFKKLKVRERESGFKYGYPYMQAIKECKSGRDMNVIEKKGFGIYEQAISASGGYAYVTELSRGEKGAKISQFYGIKTPAMQNHGEYLNSSMKAYFLKVISGRDSIDKFNNFISDYNKNGGDAVLNQVNQWFEA